MNRYSYEPPSSEATLRLLYEERGLTQVEIGALLGCSQKRVFTAMRHFGIAARKAAKRDQVGARNASWKGGRVHQGAYVYVKAPEHPRATANGYVAEHILIATKKYGRPPAGDEVVHHIDMDKHNNSPENLVYASRGEHARWHRQMETVVGELFAAGLFSFDSARGYYVEEVVPC